MLLFLSGFSRDDSARDAPEPHAAVDGYSAGEYSIMVIDAIVSAAMSACRFAMLRIKDPGFSMASLLSSTGTLLEERLLISNLHFSDRKKSVSYDQPKEYLKPGDFSSNSAANSISYSSLLNLFICTACSLLRTAVAAY